MIDVEISARSEPEPARPVAPGRDRLAAAPIARADPPPPADRNDRLGGLLARAVAARQADAPAQPATEFRMGGVAHHLTLTQTDAGPVVVMASTPEDVRKKLERFEKAVTLYTQRLTDHDLAQDPGAINLLKQIAGLKAKVDANIGAFNPRRYDMAATQKVWGKSQPTIVVNQQLVDSDDRNLGIIAERLEKLATTSGIKGMDPVDIELWLHRRFMKDVVQPKQLAVAAVIGPYIDDIQAAWPSAVVKFRGSLARGLKSFPKPDPVTGGVQRFDPTAFDADAFIEISNDDWNDFRDFGATTGKLTLADALVLARGAGATGYEDVLAEMIEIEAKIRADLGAVQGYKQKTVGRGRNASTSADFYFVIQSRSASGKQIEKGNPYKAGMLAKGGMPEIEQGSVSQDDYNEFPEVAKFLNETHVQVHSDSSISWASTWDWI